LFTSRLGVGLILSEYVLDNKR